MLCLTNQNIKTPKLSKIIRYLTDNLDAVGKVRYEVNNLRDARLYRWLELPQVSFLSRQIFCRNKHVFVETKHVFCRDKSMHVSTKHVFVATNIILSRQAYFCRDKHVFVATKVCLRLSRQKLYLWQLPSLIRLSNYWIGAVVLTSCRFSCQTWPKGAFGCRLDRLGQLDSMNDHFLSLPVENVA